ncbi:MAG: DUF5320 domain-containing protein [Tissierellia bacterium]|nr:DUF5320 domain-containing protein [Tissierellia bacterium]
MPRRDGTGPMGMGSMTGRGFGLRKNNNMYGGRCFGHGLGRGFDCRYDYLSNKEMLQKQKEILQIRLKAIEDQLDEQ